MSRSAHFALPDSMTAIEIIEFGGPEVLRATRRPVPEPAAGEVLIRVTAAGVNRPDIMQRIGLYPPPPDASDIPGLEIAGTIMAVGENVVGPAEGDSVCALVTGGGYAEFCLAAAPLCLPIPHGLNAIQAAALPEACFTVWSTVFQRGALEAGQQFLVHGGTSGIGTTAIQLAHVMGAHVFTTAGTDEKCRICEQLGADVAINYRTNDFVERIQSHTKGQGVDLILDIIGGDYLQRNLASLADDGRLVQIALQHGPKSDINLLPILLKRLTLTGATLRPRSVTFKAAIADALKENVWPLLDAGSVRPVIFKTFPLTEASEAHRLMESSAHIGKIVLTV
jgi:putative PIG3 family NAD(P)H quinone oxidoreductase